MKEVKIGMRRMIVKLLEERREWIGEVSKLKYLGCVLNESGTNDEECCRRRGLKVNAGKRKVMVLNGKDRLEE